MYAVIGKMRYEYTKELQHLKDSVTDLHPLINSLAYPENLGWNELIHLHRFKIFWANRHSNGWIDQIRFYVKDRRRHSHLWREIYPG